MGNIISKLTIISLGPKTATFTLTLTVNDVNDHSLACSKTLYAAKVAENAAPTTAVVTLACTDGDATAPNNVITYSFVAGSGI